MSQDRDDFGKRRKLSVPIVIVGAALAWATLAGAAESPIVDAFSCSVTAEENNRAVAAFQQMLPVLRHPRCANCHGKIDVFSPEAATTHGRKDKKGQQVGGRQDPSEGISQGDGNFETCQACHTGGWALVKKTRATGKPDRDGTWKQPAPESQAAWASLSDEAICKAIKDSPKVPAADFIKHLHDDVLVTLGFEGRRGHEKLTPERPPMSQEAFIALAQDWMRAMKAEHDWPQGSGCGCVRVPTPEEATASCQRSYPDSIFTRYKNGQPQCDCASGSSWNRAHDACITQQARADEDAASCRIKYPNSILAGYENGQSRCGCAQGWTWNRANDACITQQARADEDAGSCRMKYPNSTLAGYENGQSQCGCPQGWVWNRANNACITQQARADEDAASCRMKYPNSTLVGYENGQSQCGCPRDWVWNRADNACVTIALREREEAAECARRFDGSMLESFDVARGASICNCPRGQVWNGNRTACVREQVVAASLPVYNPPPTYSPPPTYHAPPPLPARRSEPASAPNSKSALDACVQCVNSLTTGSCYVRIPKLAGWGLCLSCTPDGGVEPRNRFIDRDRCPVCQNTGWKLEDFKVYKRN